MVSVGVLVAAPPVAAHKTGDPPAVHATDTAAALVAAFDDGQAAVDDSLTTSCMVTDRITGYAPEAVAYRTDRIAIRTWQPETLVRSQLRAALNTSGGAAVGIGVIEKVDFPGLEDTIEPVLYAELHSDGMPAPVVETARRLWNPPHMTAAPVYLMSFNGDDTDHGPLESWPNGPPEPTDTKPPVRKDTLGSGVTIAVYDMGMPDPTQAVWSPHVTRLTAGDVEQIDAREPFGVADYVWTGHDVAIASVINTVAPGATIEAVRMTEPSGVPTEESAARRMARTLSAAHTNDKSPQLAINAFGTPGCLIDPDRPELGDMVPLGLEMVADAVDHFRETLIVASAGNRGTPRRYYPAAFPKPSILSVGALDTGGAWTSSSRSAGRADFSNFGNTVEAWAPGVDLVARHVIGVRFDPNGPLINGWATVDGTSYSGPYVGGMIAEQMAATPGSTALEAWKAIAKAGARCSADIGGGVAVALTTLEATPTTPPTASQPPLC
jgi:hypothetical protein